MSGIGYMILNSFKMPLALLSWLHLKWEIMFEHGDKSIVSMVCEMTVIGLINVSLFFYIDLIQTYTAV